MTVLVTGGAGFIGSNFIFYWMKNHPGDKVICLDKLTYAGNLSTLKAVMDEPDFRFVKGDICDKNLVFDLFRAEHPEVVVNLRRKPMWIDPLTALTCFCRQTFSAHPHF